MGRKNRRREASRDLEATASDESDTNASNSGKIPEFLSTGVVGEPGDSNDNRQTDNRNGGGRSREGKRASRLHPRQEVPLGPWTQAVSETVRGMDAAQRAINNLQGMFTTHVNDLDMIDEIKRRVDQLEGECNEKDAAMKSHVTTISTLRAMDQEAKAGIENDREQIAREREDLKLEKAKLKSRVEVATAEELLKMKRSFEERTARNDESHKARMKELELEFTQNFDEINTKATALETEKKQTSAKAEQQEKTLVAQTTELDQLKEQYDLLKRAKDSFKREKEDLEKELERMNKEFALDNKTAAHFEPQFAAICGEIERISWEYFHDIEEEDWEEVHKRLIAEDPCFKSVPIDDSKDSVDLRAAHAQRIISAAIYDNVWKPLHSELTFQHPELSTLLGKISDAFDKTDLHGRTANVWTALTMRALQALDAEAANLPVPGSEPNVRSEGCKRANKVVYEVVRVLGPLISATRIESLRTDLLTVVDSSIDVWNNAQAGGMRITIDQLLDCAQREEWRSHKFDPVLPPADGSDLNIVSRTRPRVFTLFPRIVARNEDMVLPGSWPELRPTVIHHEIGLPEWSPLVLRGKHEQEEREERMTKAIQNVKKEMQRTRRVPEHSRNGSIGSLTSGLPSPSAQWKFGGPTNIGSKTEYE